MTSKYTRQDLQSFSNEKLLSKWSIFASFIRFNEYNEADKKDWSNGWHSSREKAIKLLRSKTAEEYLNKARSASIQINAPLPEVQVIQKPPETDISETNFQEQELDIYEENYQKIIRLIPDLEERMIHDKSVTGYSNAIGFQGILMLTPIRNEDNSADFQLYHFIKEMDKYRVETLFCFRLNIPKMHLESLIYQNCDELRQVYHKKEGHKRELLDPFEQKEQNQLLSDWLDSLTKDKHHFIWAGDSEGTSIMATLNLFKYNFEHFTAEVLEESIEEVKQDVEQKTIRLSANQKYIEGLYNAFQKEKELERENLALQVKKDQEELVRQELINSINEIPVFEIGSVQLIETHKKLGVTQEDIDWVNYHKKSIAFFPDRTAENKMIGFRLLNTGRIQFGIN
jgi:uncharacterized protein YqiB (DUF1249 family)